MQPPHDMNITLNCGVQLPRVGLGTYQAGGVDVYNAVKCALAAGMRHIDTAAIYKNEAEVGRAIREWGPREQVFITSKVSPYQQGRQKAAAAFQESLEKLQTSYVDLMLIHWPGASGVPADAPLNAQLRWETWQVLQEQVTAGRARAIGVSNYEESHLAELLAKASIPPAVNQFEVHPRRPCTALRQYCAQQGVAVVAYASLGRGDLLGHPVVQQVSQQVHKTPAQVLLRWGLHKGCAVIPKSINPGHIQEFTPDQLMGWELPPEAVAALDGLEDGGKYCWDPSATK